MADLTDLQAAQTVKIAGSDSAGVETNAVGADSNGNMQVITTADGPVTPGTVASKSALAGGQFNTALPTLTNTQQAAIQLDSSGRIIIAPLTSASTTTAAEDHNFGTVGANTLRAAAQIGNATGAALFGAGTTTAQVLRVVLPTDQTAIPVTQSGAWTVAATQSGTWTVTAAEDKNYGTVGATTLRTASQIGNATGAALFGAGTTTAQVLRVVLPTDQTAIPATQSGTWNINNISGTISLPTGAATSANQTTEITALQLIDNPVGSVGAGAAGTSSFLIGGVFNTALPTLTNTQQAAVQLDSSGRLIIAPLTSSSTTTAAEDHNFGTVGANTLRAAAQIGNATGAADFNAGATGAQTLRVVANQGAANTHANAWFTRLTDGTDDSLITPNGDLQTVDFINVNGQNRAQSVTTSAAEALGAASILTNRKSLTVTPTNGTVYWGYGNTVTTSNGTPIFKNQTVAWAVGPSVHVYLICASGTVDCRITEGS